ncbi:MAG: cation transporter [Kiritimatiellae bacterium]|nr:cation transporter [Kiritimatiellia bacterium]
MINASIEAGTRNAAEIRRVTWIGLVINLFLAGFKFVVGTIGASQAVVADAVHSLSDMTTDLAVLFGLKFWTAPADEEHPYGHRRIETLVTTAIGLALAAVAVAIAYKALATMEQSHLKPPGWIASLGALVSIILKEGLYRWTVAVGRRARSSAVIANAWHHRSDAMSSVPVFVAVVLAALKPAWAFVDDVGAVLVALFILKVAWDITLPALHELADRGAPRDDLTSIRAIATGVEGVRSIHAIRTRKLGPGLHVDLHIQVDGDMTVWKGHSISGAVKSALIEKGPDVLDVVVHIEPFE